MENSLFKKWFDIFVVRYTQFYLFELFLATTKLEMSKVQNVVSALSLEGEADGRILMKINQSIL